MMQPQGHQVNDVPESEIEIAADLINNDESMTNTVWAIQNVFTNLPYDVTDAIFGYAKYKRELGSVTLNSETKRQIRELQEGAKGIIEFDAEFVIEYAEISSKHDAVNEVVQIHLNIHSVQEKKDRIETLVQGCDVSGVGLTGSQVVKIIEFLQNTPRDEIQNIQPDTILQEVGLEDNSRQLSPTTTDSQSGSTRSDEPRERSPNSDSDEGTRSESESRQGERLSSQERDFTLDPDVDTPTSSPERTNAEGDQDGVSQSPTALDTPTSGIEEEQSDAPEGETLEIEGEDEQTDLSTLAEHIDQDQKKDQEPDDSKTGNAPSTVEPEPEKEKPLDEENYTLLPGEDTAADSQSSPSASKEDTPLEGNNQEFTLFPDEGESGTDGSQTGGSDSEEDPTHAPAATTTEGSSTTDGSVDRTHSTQEDVTQEQPQNAPVESESHSQDDTEQAQPSTSNDAQKQFGEWVVGDEDTDTQVEERSDTTNENRRTEKSHPTDGTDNLGENPLSTERKTDTDDFKQQSQNDTATQHTESRRERTPNQSRVEEQRRGESHSRSKTGGEGASKTSVNDRVNPEHEGLIDELTPDAESAETHRSSAQPESREQEQQFVDTPTQTDSSPSDVPFKQRTTSAHEEPFSPVTSGGGATQSLLPFDYIFKDGDGFTPEGVNSGGILKLGKKEYGTWLEAKPRNWSVHEAQAQLQIATNFVNSIFRSIDYELKMYVGHSELSVENRKQHLEKAHQRVANGEVNEPILLTRARQLHIKWLESLLEQNQMTDRHFYFFLIVSPEQMSQFNPDAGLASNLADVPVIGRVFDRFTTDDEKKFTEEDVIEELDERIGKLQNQLRGQGLSINRVDSQAEALEVAYRHVHQIEPIRDLSANNARPGKASVQTKNGKVFASEVPKDGHGQKPSPSLDDIRKNPHAGGQ